MTRALSVSQRPPVQVVTMLLVDAGYLAADGGSGANSADPRRFHIYTPELNLMAETEHSTATTPAIEYEYIWMNGIPIAQEDVLTSTTHWTFTDHLGTPLLQTNAAGAVDWRAEHEPYGAVYEFRAGAGRRQVLRFPGQEEGEGAHSYNLSRWYTKFAGRYTQSDPLSPIEQLNWYGYAAARPTNQIDPFGLYTIEGFSRRGEELFTRAMREVAWTINRTPCCLGDLEEVVKRFLSRADLVFRYDSSLPTCAQPSDGTKLGLESVILIGRAISNPEQCRCGVASAITHEAVHVAADYTGEELPESVDESCWSCRPPVGGRH